MYNLERNSSLPLGFTFAIVKTSKNEYLSELLCNRFSMHIICNPTLEEEKVALMLVFVVVVEEKVMYFETKGGRINICELV